MKIKNLMVAFAATAAIAATFSSCSKDENVITNVVSEYKYNDELVAAQKAKSGNDVAVLLVAFGSTWNNAFQAFDNTKAAYEEAFKKNGINADVYVCFSSDICINRASKGENGVVRDYYEPRYLLHAIGAAKYDKIYVQSLQVIPGEEFANVVACVKKFMNNGYVTGAHLDDTYLKALDENKAIFLGLPLLNDPEEDVPAVAAALNEECKDKTDGVVAFMGHGNPNSYDTFKANVRYNQLEQELNKINPGKYYVGCVDQPENFKTFVYAVDDEEFNRVCVKNKVAAGSTIYLYPLMSIAGDHAHNDMAGDDEGEALTEDEMKEVLKKNPEAEFMKIQDMYYELNDEGEIEEMSWKMFFNKLGYNCTDETCTIKGLLEIPSVRQVWINHTLNAEFLEDAYHTMNIEEE